jgi:hypothetical protein
MTDKELLELAAKAAGIEIKWDTPYKAVWDFAQVPNWTPLTDDGDALRLAVKLMEFEPYKSRGNLPLITSDVLETRRAITRAAAAIGKEMP